MNNIKTLEKPVALRMNEKFETKYGAESSVMRSILHWRNILTDFHRPYNCEMDSPVTHADLDAAENEMLAEIRRYGAQTRALVVTEEMAMAGYDAMREPQTNSPAPWIVLGTAFKVFEAMLSASSDEKATSNTPGQDVSVSG